MRLHLGVRCTGVFVRLGKSEGLGLGSVHVGDEEPDGAELVAGHHQAATFWESDGEVLGCEITKLDGEMLEARKRGQDREVVGINLKVFIELQAAEARMRLG